MREIRVLRVRDVLLIVKEWLVVYVIHPIANVVRRDMCDLRMREASLCSFMYIYIYLHVF